MRHLSKKLSVTVNAQHVSAVAATATCSGVNAGFTDSKLSLCMNPQPSGIASYDFNHRLNTIDAS